MDAPTSLSSCDRPAKRQPRISHDAHDDDKAQKATNSNLQMVQPSKLRLVSVRTPGSLAAEFMKLINYNDALATPALKLLDFYFCLWECYVVKSAEKIRLEEEQRQLQESNEWLASDSNILQQLCDEQALILWDQKRAVQALCNGVVSSLQASETQACHADRH
ncbi:unnamed protein product [Penicillium salamii]|uniref:Uncharacterized protein n=1 Tax=Penicillium salamii TaxID=1612424 RepID=A0A9W4IKK1_9EURO|nr:unnamed protein product [Penicillium salamii]CAG7996377.1 unnamed protein product [Penicillium salamii]CAG8016155.1 unnamed protein product [Penicillium salamii]CAG8058550.1 unnamed protein product [Penicillium salamii]CAG8278800.1 unnamed protein product [Penicillium salamii]